MGSRTERFFSGIPQIVIGNRYTFLGGLLLLVALSVMGAGKLQLDMSMESFFEDSDPVKITYNQFRETFGGDDSIYIVYKAKDGDVLSKKSLQALQSIHEEIEEATMESEEGESILEHLVEIKSLLNVSYLEVDKDSFNSREFINDKFPESNEEREKIRDSALQHHDYPQFYITKDSKYAGIYIRTDFGVTIEEGENSDALPEQIKFTPTDIQDHAAFLKALVRILNKKEHAAVLEFHPVGNPVIMAFFNDVINIEMEQFFSIAFLLMFIVLFILFRNFSAVLWSLLLIIVTILSTIGFMGWAGLKMNIMIGLLVMLLLVIGIADAVHILSGYVFYRKENFDHVETMKLVYQKSGFACFLTSITTSIGLMSLVFVKIPPIRYFGISAAFGVLMAFLLTMVLLPILINIWQPISQKQLKSKKQNQTLVQNLLSRFEPFANNHGILIVLITLCVIGVSGYGLTKVKVDSNMVEILKDNSPIKIAHNLVDQYLGGSQNMDIYIKFAKEDALKDPKVLNAMEEFQQQLTDEHPEFVTRTHSIVNVVKNTHQVLHENRKDKYLIPQKRDMLSQTLLIFETSSYDDRKQLVSDDYRNARINIRLKNYGSLEYLTFFEDTENKVETLFNPLKEGYPELKVEITGGLALMMRVIDYISWAQIQSFGLTLTVITIMLLFVFGNPKFGLIGILPNLIPVMITFGVMGLFGIPLDGDTLIIAPIVMGVAVDDTVHFLTHYRLEISKTNGNISESIRLTIKEAGQAITFSTLILVIGFLILMFSAHKGIAHFGLLAMVAFTSALLADLLLLPALCHLFQLKPKRLK